MEVIEKCDEKGFNVWIEWSGEGGRMNKQTNNMITKELKHKWKKRHGRKRAR